nr:unnamed protein product [Callosobruchus chinensis]
MNGYNFFRRDRLGRGGGVALYSRVVFKFSLVDINLLGNTSLEIVCCKCKIHSSSLLIIVVYRPPHCQINDSINQIDNLISFFTPQYDNIILLGDVNIDMLDPTNVLSNCLDFYGFRQVIDEPTRITRFSSTLIDAIFVSNIDIVEKSGTLNADLISDHKLVFCELAMRVSRVKEKFVTYRDLKNMDIVKFKEDLKHAGLECIFYINDINRKVDILTNVLLDLLNFHAPFRTARVTKNAAPWLSFALKAILRERDKALVTFKQHPSDENWDSYKGLRNFALASIRREKKAYLAQFGYLNSKKSWEELRKMNVCPEKNVDIPLDLLEPDEVNNHFLSNFQNANINSRLIEATVESYRNDDHNQVVVPFSFKLVTAQEILDVATSIKSTATGSDDISLNMIKFCLPELLKFLTHIVNVCLETGFFPDAWKEAVILPLAKSKNPLSHDDLRPISILCFFSKILEKVVYLQLTEYLEQNGLLPSYQSGFRAGHSTTSALLNLTDNIIRNMDKHVNTVLVMIDFSKAFDTVNHKVLLSKLKHIGLSDIPLNFFEHYLVGRRQKVKTIAGTSSIGMVSSGVPQGSVLGPLLYLLYTFDLDSCIEHCAIQTYADDTQLTFHFDSLHLDEVSYKINLDLANITDYCKRHLLRINPDKSSSMLFCPKHLYKTLIDRIVLIMDNKRIPIVEHVKNLGVILDQNLRFDAHVSYLSRLIYIKLKLLYTSRFILNFKTRKKLVETLVLSTLNYALILYYPCLDSVNKSRLQRMQNNCCRFVFGLRKYSHVSSKVKELRWLNMERQCSFNFKVFIHKIVCSNQPSYLIKKLVTRGTINSRELRHNNNFTMPVHYSAIFQKCFTFNAVRLYNTTNPSWKNKSLKTFRGLVKSQLLEEI